jgi:DNA-3-methyladenine glycosylase
MKTRALAMRKSAEIPLHEIETRAEILPRSFYGRTTVDVARDLLGKILVHGRTAGRIVETEAYLGLDDRAAHASRGITPRTRVLFGPPGHAYVYFIYGMYECLNLVAEPEGTPGCVLIRALEPLAGIAAMRRRRPHARTIDELASGPGKLTRAMGITRRQNGGDVTSGPLTVRSWPDQATFEIGISPRIGIQHCRDWPLRFFIDGNSCVSRHPVAAPGR